MYTVTNPDFRAKAVRVAGGLLTIEPNKTVEVEADWDDWWLERYRAAGLEITGEGVPPADVSTDPSDDPASSKTDRASVLKDVIQGFPEDDDDYWMTDGRPQVNKLNESGVKPAFTAAERDELWASIKDDM